MTNSIHPLVMLLVPFGLLSVVIIEHWASGKIEDALVLLKKHNLLGQKMKLERIEVVHSRYSSSQYSIFFLEKQGTRIEIRKDQQTRDLEESPILTEETLSNKTQIRVINDKRVIYSKNYSWVDTVLSHILKRAI